MSWVMGTSGKQGFKTQSLSVSMAVLDPPGLEPDLELPGQGRAGARVVARVVVRVVVRVGPGVGASRVGASRVGASRVGGSRVGAISLLGLLPPALAAVVGVHHPEVGQHLLGIDGVLRVTEKGG